MSRGRAKPKAKKPLVARDPIAQLATIDNQWSSESISWAIRHRTRKVFGAKKAKVSA